MNSVLLLLICAVGAGLLLAVHLVALCSHRNRFILGAGVGNCYLILSIGAKLLAAACVCYSVWFLQTQLNAEQGQVLGLRWKEGGEIFVCVVYTTWIAMSVLRVPVIISAAKGKTTCPVWIAVFIAAVASVLLAVASYSATATTEAAASDSESGTDHDRSDSRAALVMRLAAVYVAIESICMDLFLWMFLLTKLIHPPPSATKDSLLPSNVPRGEMEDDRSRRLSTNRPPQVSCLASKRVKDLKTSSDWWSVWIGVANLTWISIASGAGAHDRAVPKFQSWVRNPLESIVGAAIWVPGEGWCLEPCKFNAEAVLWGMISLFGTLLLMVLHLVICTWVTKSGTDVLKVVPAFFVLFVFTCVSRVLGGQEFFRQYGLSATLWALALGLVLVNVLKRPFPKFIAFLKPAASQGEFFIKIGLVLLCVEFGTLASFGVPSLIVSWLVTPLVLLGGWWFGRRVCSNGGWLAPTHGDGMSAELVMCIAAGTAVCGTSAIAAIKSAINADGEESVLAISIVSFMTIFFTLALPYFAKLVNMANLVAGAWIGGTVNNTGNVVASAAILDDEDAEEVAAIVKMLQNAMIGPITVAVTAFWVGVVSPVSDGEKDIQIKKKGCWQTLLLLYDRFPKFVLGFFLCSIAVTILATEGLLGQRQVKTNLLQLARQASDWWNIVGFVGLGLETDISELVAKMRSSGGLKSPLYLYFGTQFFNAVLTLAGAYLSFQVLEWQYQDGSMDS